MFECGTESWREEEFEGTVWDINLAVWVFPFLGDRVEWRWWLAAGNYFSFPSFEDFEEWKEDEEKRRAMGWWGLNEIGMKLKARRDGPPRQTATDRHDGAGSQHLRKSARLG